MDTRSELRERLRRSRNWLGAIDELEREAEELASEQDRSERLYWIGTLTEEIVPERDRALAIYQRAWKLYPENLKALARARQVYRELGRLEMVAKLGEIELKSSSTERAGELAALVGEALLDCRQRDKALPLLEMALEALPDSSRVKDAIAAANYDAEDWIDVVDRLSSEAENADSTTAARMLLRAARIVGMEQPDDDTYEKLLERVLAFDAQNESANFLYEQLLAAQERWAELEKHHERRAYAAPDEGERADLYRQFGLEWVQRFKDRERGARFFTKAIAAVAENGEARMRSLVAAFALLREIYGARGEWDHLLELSDSALSHLHDDQKLFVALQAGEIAWKELGSVDRARPYFEIVRSLEPAAPDLADFDREAGPVQPATVPDPGESAAAAPPEEAEARAEAEAEEVNVHDQETQSKKKRRRRKKKDSQAAVATEDNGADEGGEDAGEVEAAPEAAPEAAVESQPATQEPQEPTKKKKAAPVDEPPREEVITDELRAAMDEARQVEADSPDRGIDAWRKVIADHPQMRAPRRELARLYREHERWNALIEALKDEESSAAQTTGEKVAVLREMADVYRDQLRNDVQSVNTLNQILDLQPGRLEIYDELAAAYEDKKRWPDLVTTLTRKAEQLDEVGDQVALYLQIANLYIDRFSNQAEAIKAFEKVLELDPDNRDAIEHLKQVYEKRRDWEKLIALQEGEIARTEDPGERAAKTYEMAQLAQTRVKKPDVCIVWWEKVLETDPGHEEAIAELTKLYERSKEWDKLAEVCNKQALIASDEKTQVESLQKLGLLYTDKLENTDKAIDAWRRLLDVDPNHRRAQDALKKLYVAANDWAALEQFYRGQDKLDEFVRVLERQVDTSDSTDEQLALAMKTAVIYRDELDKSDRAVRAYEKALQIDDKNLEAAEALIPLYELGRDPRKLVPVYEIQLQHTQDPALRQERIKNLAEYSEDKLRDKGAAFGWWLRAHAEDHRAEWIREQLERLAAETGAWADLVDAYRASYPTFDDRAQALPLMLVVARVQEEELGLIDEALATNRAILELDDSNEQAVNALERLYVGKQQFDELLDIYTRKLELTTDPEQRTQIQFKIGQLYEDEVKDDAKAVEAYTAVLDAEGENLSALRALDRLFQRNERWAELADILGRELILVGPDQERAEHLDLKFRLGRVRETHLGDVPGAVDAYRDILDLDPSHEGARQALEARLGDADHRLAAADILEPIYEQLEMFERLVQVHEIQLAAKDMPMARVGLLMRIGELQAKSLGDAEKAFEAFARAFREDPATDGAKRELEELAGLLDDGVARIVRLYQNALEKDPDALDPSLAHELATKVARAYQERLDDTDKAVEFYRRALQIEPDDLDAISALEQIFTRDEKYADLLEIYRKKVDISVEPAERLDILFRIASIHEEMLGNPDDAISAYNEILGHDPDNVQALRALDRLYVQGEQWQDLGDNLTRQLVLVEEGFERVGLLVRLAQLRESHLEEVAAAVETYRQVLDLQPDNPDAISALERLMGNEEQELTIAQILEPIYKAHGDWRKQITVYEIMAKHAFDPERKIELLHQVAELYELGGENADASFETFSRAFRDDPRNEGTQAQLERMARMLERWRDLVDLYGQVIDEVAEEDLKVQLLFKLAQIHELELGSDEQAVATYRRILDATTGNVEAATRIQAIHERNADYPALVGILKRKSELIIDLPERKQLLYKAAQIQEEILEDAEAAIATFRNVLELDDIDLPAMDALERLYIRLERWEPLKDVYAKKADLAEDPDDKRQMLHVLGQVFDRELDDVGRAIETYQGILDIEPDDLNAIQNLDRLYVRGERWYDLLSNLERQVELAEVSGEIVGLKYRIGELWQLHLQDLARAIESFREALQIDPGHPETLAALDALLRSDEGEPVMAARVLEPIYEASAEFEKLIDVLEVMVQHAEDPVQKVELLHRVGEYYEHRLDRPPAAFRAYYRALKEDNANDLTLGHLERLAEYTGGWRDLAELYAAEADKTLDVPRQVDLLLRLARLHEEELGQPEDAIGTYKRILEVEFDNRAAVMALDRLYTGSERWAELSDILRKEIQLAESDEEIISLQFRLGQVLEQMLGDLPAAIEVYRDVLTTDPNHGPTLGALEMMFLEGQHQLEIATILEPLYEVAGEFEKLHKIYEVQLSKLTEAVDRQGMYQRLAELAEGRLLDQTRAFQWWGEALVEDPRWELAVEEAERLAGEIAAWEEMVSVYIRVLERHQDSEVHRQTLLRLARVYEAQLGDLQSAIDTHLRVLEIDAKDPDALAALDRLYQNAGMYEELVDVLRRRIGTTLDGDEIIEFHFRRGYIYSDALGDLDAALACYEAVLEQESRNRRALEAEEAIFFRREDWQRLYGVYEKLIDVAEDDAELGDIYSRMARISSDALQDDDAASDLWSRVLDIRGENAQALASLGELYARREMWEELADVLGRQVDVAGSDQARIAVLKRLGRVWDQKLGRERNALEAWLRADELDPNDLETLRALAYLYRQTQSWEELSQTLRRIIEVGQISGGVGEDELIELFAQLGQLEGEILGRVDDAVGAWRSVLALDATDFRALNALEQLFTREGRWEETIEVLEKRALVVEDEASRIDTMLQAAAIWEEKVENLERASEVYERVRAADASNVIASERLEAIYRAQYKWEPLAEILLERVEQREDAQDRIDILGAVAKIYEEELGDQESAFVILQAAFREDYAHEQTAKELERLATAAGKWQELLADYSEVVQGLESEDADQACNLWVKIGRWYGEHLSHVDWAIHSIQQALRINHEHLLALGALADFQRQRGSWAELIETLQKHAGLETRPDKKVALYLDLANLLETQMQQPMQAIAAYQSALEADGTSMDALTSLERLYRQHQLWEQLIDVLGRMADLRPDDQEVVRLKLEIGQLWDERMIDSGQAINAYREVLDTDPQNQAALRALEHLYEKTGQSEAYLEVLEAQLDASPTDAEQISLYERMASAWEERFGQLDRAAECYEKIVAVDDRNYAAYRELERLYQQDEKWEALVDTFRNHIMTAPDAQTRVDLFCAMGRVYEQELQDYDRAIEAYNDVLDSDPDEPRALDALGRLYEQISEWYRAIDVMGQLVKTTDDPGKQVDLYHRIGRITYAHLDDVGQAEEYFLRALTIDAAHVPTMEQLVRLYSDRGDWMKAAQMMVRAESHTQNLLDKVRLLYQAARIYLDKLGQTDQAKEFLAAVIALDPEHVDAAEPLANLYFKAGQWAELSPLLDMLVRKAQQEHRDARELGDLYYRTAKTADELGNYEKALEFYKGAYDIDSTHLPTLLGRADLLYKMQDWEGAGKIYQTILVQHRDSQDESEVVRIYYRLGMVRLQLGERKKALNMFEKALEIDPSHRDTLDAAISIHAEQGDWEAVVQHKRGLMASADPEEQVKLLDEIGNIYHERLQNPQKALAAYNEALEVTNDDHQLLQKLLDLYTETEQWKKVVETIEKFIELERNPVRKGSYYQAAGTICRDKLKALDEAIEYYNKSLDSYFLEPDKLTKSMLPRALKAFQDIDKILTTKRDWKNQERAYRHMIKRLPAGDPILPELWHALGEIYRSRLKHYQSAIGAFEVAAQLDPQNTNRGEILAELYLVAGPEYADKAVEQHMRMLRQEPFKYDSYKALRRIYMDTHQYDKTWCVCNTLAFLKKADPEEMQFYEQYKPRGFVKAKQRMTEEIWKKVYHPDENRYVSAILGAISQGAASIHSHSFKQLGLRRKDRRDVANDQLLFSKIFYYVSQVLNVPLPDVYLQDDQPGDIIPANVLEKGQLFPTFVVRQGLLQGRPEKEIAFVAARRLELLRPEHYLKLVLPTNTHLKTALMSAIVMVKRDFPVPPDMQANVAQYLPEMQKRIPPQIYEQLAHVVNRFLQNAPEVNMAKWGHAVDATGHRIGFIISGDLEVAARLVSAEPVVVGGPQVKDKIKELVLYSVSEDYFAVRSHLGLTIG